MFLFISIKIGSSDMDPLMDEAATIEGDLWLTGNRTLISLNLSSKNKRIFIFSFYISNRLK